MFKQIARTATLMALVAAPALAQTPDTRPTVAVLPFTNSAIGASTGSSDGTIISLIAACVRMSTARP